MNADMHRLAVLLMIASSVVISFSGLIVRALEIESLVMNFYRSVFLMCAVVILLVVKYRGATVVRVIGVGWPGVFAGLLLTGAAITFLQSLTHTTVANTLFILGAIPFFTAALAWVFSERAAQPGNSGHHDCGLPWHHCDDGGGVWYRISLRQRHGIANRTVLFHLRSAGTS